MNLILLQAQDFHEDGLVVLTDERARHIRKVLKAGPGKIVRIGMLNGAFGKGTVLAVDKQRVCSQCVFDKEIPPKPRIDLLLAMPRPKVIKRLWAQLAALGVGRIVVVNADKVERFYFDSHVLDPGFFNPLLIEGLQQARCTRLPDVQVRRFFKPFVEDELDALSAGSLKLVADPSGEKRISDLVYDTERVMLAVGPEGGWTPYELDKLQEHGFERFRMGSRILRTDTACIGLLSLVSERIAVD
jgi:RsmE family RNA methyltransferase